MTNAPLDFIVIGAQKSGTTSLHMYLKEHDRIYLPMGKEVPFFSDDERFKRGWKRFADEFYGHPVKGLLRGKVSNYMSDSRSPQRIAFLAPGAKLIAILRNPVDRALSHYRMSHRRGQDDRSFDEAIRFRIDPQALVAARSLPYAFEKEPECYIVWGEYGRILSDYLRYFSREQILILFTDDLENNPVGVLEQILRFLGLPDDWSPRNLGKKYHRGGDQYRFRALRRIYRSFPGAPVLNQLGKKFMSLLPLRQRKAFYFWKEIWLTRPITGPRTGMSDETRRMLVQHFATDLIRLETDFGCNVPWNEFRVLELRS